MVIALYGCFIYNMVLYCFTVILIMYFISSLHYVRLLYYFIIGVRVSPERDISSLRAFGSGGRQVLRVVRVARTLFDFFEEK